MVKPHKLMVQSGRVHISLMANFVDGQIIVHTKEFRGATSRIASRWKLCPPTTRGSRATAFVKRTGAEHRYSLEYPESCWLGEVVAAAFAYNTALLGELNLLLGGNRLRSAWIGGAVFLSSRTTTSFRSPSSSPRQGVPSPALIELMTPPPDSLPPDPDPAPETSGCHRLCRPSPRRVSAGSCIVRRSSGGRSSWHSRGRGRTCTHDFAFTVSR